MDGSHGGDADGDEEKEGRGRGIFYGVLVVHFNVYVCFCGEFS